MYGATQDEMKSATGPGQLSRSQGGYKQTVQTQPQISKRGIENHLFYLSGI